MDYRLVLFIVANIATSFLGIRVTNAQKSPSTFNVLDYGAKGDGQQDDTQAFAKAWIDACDAGGDSTTLVVPQGKTFLIKSIAFKGPCQSTSIHIQIQGNIEAPSSIDQWNKCEDNNWLHFESIDNLFVEGQGVIDSRGSIWWTKAPIINGGNGYARQITYEDIILENVQNPIIIDQYYCISYSNCANQDYRHILFIVAYIATSLLGISVTNAQNSSPTFNVLDYGAKGDGQQDDTQTFAKAWIDVCNAGGDSTTLVVPQGYTFLIKYIAFDGPCKSTTTIHIEGNIVAPSSIGEWDKCENNAWLHFGSIDNLVVEGQGVIDGRGSIWWTNAPIINNMMFFNCKGLQLSGVTSKDCPGSHIAMLHSNNSIINNINLIAPQDSHNTDGIDIASTNNLQILNSFIGTGDDCVAIGSDSIGINITNVICGPGHGISFRNSITGIDRMRASSSPFGTAVLPSGDRVGLINEPVSLLGSLTREKKRLKKSTRCQVKQHLMTKM
uniref:Polygalacturonase n=1 Tax=Chenopodium quinoa TaxID=63459 RepID=A0A803KSV4_CHEQI